MRCPHISSILNSNHTVILTLTSKAGQADILFPMAGYMGVHIIITCQNNSLQPIAWDLSWFKCIYTVILTFDLEVQGHIVFYMVDYVRVHLKIQFLQPMVVKYHDFSAYTLRFWPLTFKVKVTFYFPWLIMWWNISKSMVESLNSWTTIE